MPSLRRNQADNSKFGKLRKEDTLKVEYTLTGVSDRATAEAYVLDNMPAAEGHRGLETVDVKEMVDFRDGHWRVVGNYKGPTIKEDPEDPVADPDPAIEEISVGFSIGGKSQLMTHSLETINSYSAPGETAPSFDNQLNIVDGYPAGVDINPQSMAESTFSVEQEVSNALITNTWLEAIENAASKVNNDTFRGRAAGEVLFHGLRGTVRKQEQRSTLTWEFLVIKNITSETIGVFTAVDKKGWEYAWIYSEERSPSSQIVHAPVGLYIERLFPTVDMPTATAVSA